MKKAYLIILTALYGVQAQAFTLPKQPTKAYDCDVCSRLSHENLHDHWTISNDGLKHHVSNVQKSFGYREQVSMKDLRQGVALSILAPGAVVRVTPMNQDNPVPKLLMKAPNKPQLMSIQDASALYSQDKTFADESFPNSTQTLFQMKPELGMGNFVISSDDGQRDDDELYNLSVFDKFSTTYLEVETSKLHYQYGDKFVATIALKDNDQAYPIDEVSFSLIRPDGKALPLEATKLSHNKYRATTTLLSDQNNHGENWYIEANARSGLTSQKLVKRNGHAAFSYSIPSASLLHIKKIGSNPLTFVATVEVATPSRYALHAVLYSATANGEGKPEQMSQTALWLEPGKQVMQFTFDNSKHLSDDSLFLGYIRLIDYGQLKTVYKYDNPVKLSLLE